MRQSAVALLQSPKASGPPPLRPSVHLEARGGGEVAATTHVGKG